MLLLLLMLLLPPPPLLLTMLLPLLKTLARRTTLLLSQEVILFAAVAKSAWRRFRECVLLLARLRVCAGAGAKAASGGYCELCGQVFAELSLHLSSAMHDAMKRSSKLSDVHHRRIIPIQVWCCCRIARCFLTPRPAEQAPRCRAKDQG
jgi:hypothetical protein